MIHFCTIIRTLPTQENYTFSLNVLGCLVIFNCEIPTEKASQFLDHHLKSVMQSSWSYINDLGDFIDNIKKISNIPEDAILVTMDVAGSYPSFLYKLGLKASEEALRKRESKKISTSDSSQWLNFYFKITTLKFMEKLNSKFLVLLIGTSSHCHLHVYSSTRLNQNF